MTSLLGYHLPGTAQDSPQVDPQDKKMDELQKNLHADGKLRERFQKAAPNIAIITTPQIEWVCIVHYKQDGCQASEKIGFENVEKEMNAMQSLLMECAIPFMRGGTDKYSLKASLEWLKLFADFAARVDNVKKKLWVNYSDDIFELARQWAEEVFVMKTNYIMPGWAIWIKSWRDEDVAPAWTVFINQVPSPFNNSPPERSASIDLSGSAQKQREARRQFASQSQTGTIS